MVSLILVTVCSSCIVSRQSGGMKGHQMIDLIFALETKIIEFILHAIPHAGIFALDIASAFPSLSRKYLFWILKRMAIPKRLRRIIKSLHRSSKGLICFRNLLFGSIMMHTGVKQGDPSAMQLFIIAYDPLIRFIDASLAPVDHLLLPYCDDLALACVNVVAAWKTLVRCFVIIEKVSFLSLNCDKTQFLLTSGSTRDGDIDSIIATDSSVSRNQFLEAIKYLGIFLGNDSIRANWTPVIHEYLATSKFIASLDCGLLTKISLYNMLSISKLSFVASFFAPNKDALCAENRALQLLARGPWNAIPANMLKHVKQIGMPAQATDLRLLSSASRVRVAHCTSKTVLAYHVELERVFQSQETIVRLLDRTAPVKKRKKRKNILIGSSLTPRASTPFVVSMQILLLGWTLIALELSPRRGYIRP